MRTPLTLLAAAACLATFLAACGTPEQLAYSADPIKAMSEEYGPPCEKRGYAKDSPAWRSCIKQTSRHDDLTRQSLFHDRYMQWYWTR